MNYINDFPFGVVNIEIYNGDRNVCQVSTFHENCLEMVIGTSIQLYSCGTRIVSGTGRVRLYCSGKRWALNRVSTLTKS